MKKLHMVMYVTFGIIAGLIGGIMLSSAKADDIKYDYNQVVARIGETTITRGQLAERTINRFGVNLLDGEFANELLIRELALRKNITVSAEEVNDRIDEYKFLTKQYKEFVELLGGKSNSDEVARYQLEDRFRASLLAEKVLDIKITTEDVNKMSFTCAGQLMTPTMVKLNLIACTEEMKANEALQRLKKGEDAAAISKLYSVAEIAKNSGELKEWFTEDTMLPEVADEIFGSNRNKPLKVKGFTKVIKINDPQRNDKQYLIFTVTEFKPSFTPSPADVMPVAKFLARADKLARMWPSWYKEQSENPDIKWERIDAFADPVAKLTIMPLPLSTKKGDK
jgi:parvulin-like peptidyl-prolyl isomerase